jgi:hypothetical protein
MTYKIIISAICIIFIVALIGNRLKKENEEFESNVNINEDSELLIINGEKLEYSPDSKHGLVDLKINDEIMKSIEFNPLSIIYISNKNYDLTNLYITSIFKLNSIQNNTKLFKCNNFEIEIINNGIKLKTNKGTKNIDLNIKENEYYTYSLGITPKLISFRIKDDPDSEKEHYMYQNVDNKYLDKLYIGDNFNGNAFIKPRIFRQEIERFQLKRPSVKKPLIIRMEENLDTYRIYWDHNTEKYGDETVYYVIIMRDINNKDMMLNLAVPLVYKKQFFDIKKSDLKYPQTIITLRIYYNNTLEDPSNKLIINK